SKTRRRALHERTPPPRRGRRGRGGSDNQVKQTEFTASSASLQPNNTIGPSGPIAPWRACWSAPVRPCLVVHTPKQIRRHVRSLHLFCRGKALTRHSLWRKIRSVIASYLLRPFRSFGKPSRRQILRVTPFIMAVLALKKLVTTQGVLHLDSDGTG